MKRRHFLHLALTATTSACAAQWVNARPTGSSRQNPANSSSQRLIVIMLRGAVDGLNVVVPYQEAAYYQLRETIAIPKPGQPDGAIDLDGFFGLHPALAPLQPLWQQQSLAFVHACGSPFFTRSHFDAQTYLENGTPGDKSTPAGWMNRLLAVLPNSSPVAAISVEPTLPRILQGSIPVINLPANGTLLQPLPLDTPAYRDLFNQLYQDAPQLHPIYQEGREARQILRRLISAADPENPILTANEIGRPTFANNARQLAALMVQEPQIQLAFMSIDGGWDTHVAQGGSTGALANQLRQLAEGLKVLVDGLGSIYAETTIVVFSEFGRTVQENLNRGTDHGYGNVLWLLGGKIRGGQVYGDWRGLATNELHQGRFLPITTDFRDPLSTLLQTHLHLDRSRLSQVFPDFTPQSQLDFLS
ncbi:MAG: DUF1501 domain-containing protein [Elainella sp. Prado103]|jgi:uncharacterized protein (DUF1501 family)|nr:DUF1501 domain-containing protein [Elainella sp. Prado103]